MSESDWVTLDAVNAFLPAGQLEEMRQRYLALRESVSADLERRKAAAASAAASAIASVATRKAEAGSTQYRKQNQGTTKPGKKSGAR